jgi:HD-GYP domain-containing protein (c-di-GMP phosphodiesterase class II)
MRKTMTTAFLILAVILLPSPPLHPEDDGVMLYKQGMEQYEKKNYKSAYDFFRRALLKNPFNEEASVMYWKMKSEHKIHDLTDRDEGQPKDSKILPINEGKEEKEAVPERPRKKETRQRDVRMARESAAAVRELRAKVSALTQRIESKELEIASERTAAREREIALTKKRDSENDRALFIFRLLIILIVAMLAISLGMVIFAFLTISAIKKHPPATLLPDMARPRHAIAPPGIDADHAQAALFSSRHGKGAWSTESGEFFGQAYSSDAMGLQSGNTSLPIGNADQYKKMETIIAGFIRLIEQRLKRENNDFRVREICRDIGTRIGLTSIEIAELCMAALIKDAGFLLVPEALLLKKGKLNKKEREMVHQHVSNSIKIARNVPLPMRVLDAVENHHERMDGSGYPRGLKRDTIPLFSRIIGVCDSFVALTSDRPYRSALDDTTALAVLQRESQLYDPEILHILFDLIAPPVVHNGKHK